MMIVIDATFVLCVSKENVNVVLVTVEMVISVPKLESLHHVVSVVRMLRVNWPNVFAILASLEMEQRANPLVVQAVL